MNSSVCSAPCEIVGDISYEELRTAAYDDARRGLSFQSIVRKPDIPHLTLPQLHAYKHSQNLLTFIFVQSMKIHLVHASFTLKLLLNIKRWGYAAFLKLLKLENLGIYFAIAFYYNCQVY